MIGHVAGDSQLAISGDSDDYRDNQWHVAMLTFRPGSTGSCKLWIDGVLSASHTGGACANINTTAGTDYIRVGATGLPTQVPTGGAALQVRDIMIVPLDLNDAANETTRKLILNRLLKVWRGGGISA